MAETEPNLAKKIHIYSNGDRFFTGRRFVINPRQTRNYESFLNQVTQSLKPAFGAVRVLRTPENGHPVGDLGDLETGRSYVACAQKFVKLGYEDITLKPKPAPSPERKNKVIASGRIRKIERTPIAIFVYTNGEVLEQAKRILLKPWVQKTWETVLVAINEKINLRTGAVRHIMDFVSKDEVTEGVHLKNNEYYVAVGSEKFKDFEYGMQHAILSPKQQQKRRYPTLQPLKKKSKSGSNTESEGSSPLESSTNSTQSMGKRSDDPSPPKYKKKAAAQPANNEEGIPIKPIKHKRGSSDKSKEAHPPPAAAEEPKKKPATRRQPPPKESSPPANSNKKAKPVDLDKDEGGVFKSKAKKQKASEVKEEKGVKEELPIDKRKAEEVEDEEVQTSPRKKEPLPPVNKNKKKAEPSPKKSDPVKKEPVKKNEPAKKAEPAKKESPKKSPTPENKDNTLNEEEAATKIQSNYKGYKTRKDLAENKTEPDDKPNKEEPKESEQEEDNTKDKAAVKIQANYRGYKTRKDLTEDNAKDQEEKPTTPNPEDDGDKSEADNEHQKNEAATTIQAGYRGHQARKEVKAIKEAKQGDASSEEAKQGEEARAPSSQSKSNG